MGDSIKEWCADSCHSRFDTGPAENPENLMEVTSPVLIPLVCCLMLDGYLRCPYLTVQYSTVQYLNLDLGCRVFTGWRLFLECDLVYSVVSVSGIEARVTSVVTVPAGPWILRFFETLRQRAGGMQRRGWALLEIISASRESNGVSSTVLSTFRHNFI